MNEATTYDNANVHVSTVAKASPTYSYTSILSKQQHSETVAKNLMNSKRIPVHGSTTLSVTKRPTERRVSSRSIKRKKFDDEVVESSLNQGAGGSRGKFVTNEPSIPDPTPPPKEKAKANCKLKRPVRRGRKLVALAEMGRWKPQDDLMLINSVQQVCDLTAVYKGVKFSTHFTKDEIQQRWYALLYDSNISKCCILSVTAALTQRTGKSRVEDKAWLVNHMFIWLVNYHPRFLLDQQTGRAVCQQVINHLHKE